MRPKQIDDLTLVERVRSGNGLTAHFSKWLGRMRLIEQFSLALIFVLLTFVITLGTWLNNRATIAVLDASAGTAATYLQLLLEPHVQSIAETGSLSAEDESSLKDFSAEILDRHRIVALKVWLPDGRLAFSDSEGADIEHPSDEITEALRGRVVGRLSDHHDVDATDTEDENDAERMYEIYAPLKSGKSTTIIAIGEFYQNADIISETLVKSAQANWLRFGFGGLMAFIVLFLVVLRGSNVIERQRMDLLAQLERQRRLTDANALLQNRIESAHRNSAQIERRVKRRLGADLHDGACQLVAAVLLGLDKVKNRIRDGGEGNLKRAAEILDDLRESASEAMNEIRAVSHGLSAPHIEGHTSVNKVLRSVVSVHERRTGISVALVLGCDDLIWPEEAINSTGRLVEEALNNAKKHAPEAAVRIRTKCDGDNLTIMIEDDGPGIDEGANDAISSAGGLGLPGMKFRAEALGGTFCVSRREGRGTQLEITLPVVQLG